MSSPLPHLWELVGSTGQFDYIEHTPQYGPWDLYDLDNMCRAAELTNTSTVIKIDRNPKDFLAQRAIAGGFNGILFADIITAEEVKDCVKAYLFLAEKMLADRTIHGEAFNFSNELQIAVLELVKKIGQLMERADLEPLVLNEVKGEIRHQYLSAQKARERLGWKAAYTLDEGLVQTIAWYREFFGEGAR